jgi:hypothetical protein
MRPPLSPRLDVARAAIARELIRIRCSLAIDPGVRAARAAGLAALARELEGWADLARLVERPRP